MRRKASGPASAGPSREGRAMAEGKADFRALRERLGLTQQDVAKACGVVDRTVKRWEKPGWPEPPEDAWGYLYDMHERLLEMTAFSVGKARELREGAGAGAVRLTYFRDQSQHDAHGRGEGPVGFANAVSRSTAKALLDEGFDVEFAYPDDGAIGTPVSRS